jgi:fatty acid desaturase
MENISFMNFLDLLQLLVDVGLVVLIWIVQLIIYPSFLYYDSDSLSKWHKVYTGRITIIVAPLMIAQIAIAAYLLLIKGTFSIPEIAALIFIAVNWLITMFIFIPLHEHIDTIPDDRKVQRRLVHLNWWRVLLFCMIFLIHLIYFISLEF